MSKNTLIVIPAKYYARRIPGKSLVKVAGKEILRRSWEIAQIVKKVQPNVDVLVATDDHRIKEYCKQNQMEVMMTSEECRTGTERVIEAVSKLKQKPDFIVNLEVDNLCPPWFIEALITRFNQSPSLEVITPCLHLTWEELDKLRKEKESNPFYGTTVVFDKNCFALWFSKQILPAIRREEELRESNKFSPVYMHFGLYGFRYSTLNLISKLEKSRYQDLEGLEQLTALQEGIDFKMQEVDYRGREGMFGIDEMKDIKIAERFILKHGDFHQYYYFSDAC